MQNTDQIILELYVVDKDARNFILVLSKKEGNRTRSKDRNNFNVHEICNRLNNSSQMLHDTSPRPTYKTSQ
jgi:hypothetical protein